MNERSLGVFLEVLKTGSMRSAADNMFVSSQSVSKTVLELEEELGEKLFIRDRKRLIPTRYALELKKHAERILEEFALIRKQSGYTGRRSLKVYCTFGIPELLGASFVRDLGRKMPHILLYLIEIADKRAVELLYKNEGDSAILSDPVDRNDFSCRHLFTSDYSFVVNAGDPLAGNDYIGAKDLDGIPLVTKGNEFQLFTNQMSVFSVSGKSPDIVLETSSYHLAMQMAAEGLAIALVPDHVARYWRPEGTVRVPALRAENSKPFYYVCSKDNEADEDILNFGRFLRDWIRDNVCIRSE